MLAFTVDVVGVIEIMGTSLYSRADTPIRELIQNAHDAVVRRRHRDLSYQGRIDIEQDPANHLLRFHDDGIGLTPAERVFYVTADPNNPSMKYRVELVTPVPLAAGTEPAFSATPRRITTSKIRGDATLTPAGIELHGVEAEVLGGKLKASGTIKTSSGDNPSTYAGDLVITGSSIGDNSAVDMPRGVVRAFDAQTGALKWTWNPIPWAEKQLVRTGAANAWYTFAVDAGRERG